MWQSILFSPGTSTDYRACSGFHRPFSVDDIIEKMKENDEMSALPRQIKESNSIQSLGSNPIIFFLKIMKSFLSVLFVFLSVGMVETFLDDMRSKAKEKKKVEGLPLTKTDGLFSW